MIRRPPRSTQSRSSAASDVYKRQDLSRAVDAIPPGSPLTLHVLRAGSPIDLPVKTTGDGHGRSLIGVLVDPTFTLPVDVKIRISDIGGPLSLIHISEPTRLGMISYAV